MHLAQQAQEMTYSQGIPATVLYFLLALIILSLSFVIQDILTPGHLRTQVFVDHLPNAGMMVGSQLIAIGTVIVSAILTSPVDLLDGLIHVAVYSLLGLLLQSLFLVFAEAVIPGRFRDLVNDPKPRASVAVLSVALIVVGAINAACLT